MDAVIFDFDGVVVDSEPIHWAGFARVLRGLGVELTWGEYRERYLGFDDHDVFATILADKGIAGDEARIDSLMTAKAAVVRQALSSSVQAQPGAVELIAALAAANVPLAICSGALHPEIEIAASRVGVLQHFLAVIAAEDVEHGKPDPEGYRLAVRALTERTGVSLRPERCVAIEDSPAGIEAGKRAGLHVLAVTTSYPAAELSEADSVVSSLSDVAAATLTTLVDLQ